MKKKTIRARTIWLYVTVQVLTFFLLFYVGYIHLKYKALNPEITKYKKTHIVNENKGLVGYWSFDDPSKKYVVDISGNGNHGTFCSQFNFREPKVLILNLFDFHYAFGIPKEVDGIKGKAVEVNGRQWISCGNSEAYNTNTFTISVWVWREGEDINIPTIVAKGSWPFYDGWWLCTAPNSKKIDMGIAWGKEFKHIESGYELPYKEWHHIAVTMDNIAHEIQFYIDGKLYGKKHVNVHEWLINWNHDLFIGDYDGSGSWPWFGKIDEVHYFNKILGSEEIYELYGKGVNDNATLY